MRQLELYNDDSLIAVYSDGSKLLVSACGASFLHVDPTSYHQSRPNKTQQSTQFAVSKYRYKLHRALVFRNNFAERPFLFDLTGKEQKEVRHLKLTSWVPKGTCKIKFIIFYY